MLTSIICFVKILFIDCLLSSVTDPCKQVSSRHWIDFRQLTCSASHHNRAGEESAKKYFGHFVSLSCLLYNRIQQFLDKHHDDILDKQYDNIHKRLCPTCPTFDWCHTDGCHITPAGSANWSITDFDMTCIWYGSRRFGASLRPTSRARIPEEVTTVSCVNLKDKNKTV